jgi:twinkle protein
MEFTESDSEFVAHTACDSCGSSDANAVYDDGHTYCFSCQEHVNPKSDEADNNFDAMEIRKPSELIYGTYSELKSRKLTKQTCKKFGYMVGTHKGKPVQIAEYRDSSGKVIAQKLRDAEKNFSILGDGKSMTLFGSHLWNSGRRIIITEGEIDCMSVSQQQKHKYPVVSLSSGAASAKRAIQKNWDYLSNFEEIVLMFDQDEPGRRSAASVAEALPLGTASIASLPSKDANACLLDGVGPTIIDAIFQAKKYRPDGIVTSSDLRDVVGLVDASSPHQYPYPKLNRITKGIRPGLVTICAGSGVGKSTFVREIFYSLHKSGQICGMIMLEESTKRTIQGLVGMHLNKNLVVDEDAASQEEIEAGFDDLFKDQDIYLYDHFGTNDFETIVKRIRYMVQALDCKFICLDHVSILVSSMTAGVSDERRLIDTIMTELRTLVQELDICLILVSHLKRSQAEAGHEGGAKVFLSQLRGSHALAQLADMCIGLQVPSDDPTSDAREIVVLKNRHTGEVGHAGNLSYDRSTGRLNDFDQASQF